MKIKIKFIQSLAGSDFVHNVGDTADVPEAQATRLIEAGIATPVRTKKSERATKQTSEEQATA